MIVPARLRATAIRVIFPLKGGQDSLLVSYLQLYFTKDIHVIHVLIICSGMGSVSVKLNFSLIISSLSAASICLNNINDFYLFLSTCSYRNTVAKAYGITVTVTIRVKTRITIVGRQVRQS